MSVPVVVIGAGPFGLSISAHLSARGVEHTLVGRPMASWKEHMPPGMMLRSEPYGSDLASPAKGHDVRGYCAEHSLDYVHRLGPLPIEQFLDYADWYTSRLVQPTLDDVVTDVRRTKDGFEVRFAESAPVTTQVVVSAVGLLPFRVMPEQLRELPTDLVTHVSDHHDLEAFRGRKVAVIGGGQSALETLALLHENGADAQLVMRGSQINWLEPNPAEVNGLGHLRRPTNKLCEGWHCQFWNTPELFRRLPRDMRVDKARSVLGPAGAWWLKDRVAGVVPTHTSHTVRSAESKGDGVRLHLDGPSLDVLDVDHVMTATGFRVDLAKMDFLDPQLRQTIDTEAAYPVLQRDGESSVKGLYFAGAAAAVSLGPSVRFIAGTHNSTALLAKHAARRARAGV